MSPFLLAVVFAAILTAVALLPRMWLKRRGQELARIGEELGFRFLPRIPALEAALPGIARLGELARKHKAYNGLKGNWKGWEIVLFDDLLLPRKGDDAGILLRTVGILRLANPRVPDLHVQHHDLGTKHGARPPGEVVAFPDDRGFHERFLVLGGERAAVQRFLDSERRDLLRRIPRQYTLRTGGGWLAVFSDKRAVRARDLEDFCDWLVMIAAILTPEEAETGSGLEA